MSDKSMNKKAEGGEARELDVNKSESVKRSRGVKSAESEDLGNLGETKPKKERKRGRFSIITASGEEIKHRNTMRFWFSVVVFFLFLITCGFTAGIFYIIQGSLWTFDITINTSALIGAVALSCVAVGVALTSIASRFIFKRLDMISEGMREISKGNYKARVKEKDKKGKISEFGDLEHSFNQMATELDGIEIFRNDFIDNFSHEFKTPIVLIRGFAKQMQSDGITEEQKREYLDIIVSESERLANMSTNILLLSKLENQQIVSDRTDFYLDEQIRNAMILLEESWSEKGIEPELELEEIRYNFNEEMMSHVWINLLSNAVKFADEGGRITCRLYREGASVVCKITDEGVGMDKATLERIFEKFYQGDTSHKMRGHGIGLNIVQRIVTLARGDIKVESAPGQGTAFTVTLPV